ncbi:MAG: hypothetical protein ACR2I0_01775 [Rhodoferax sp.]
MTKHRHIPTYSILDELMASPNAPLPERDRLHQLTVMWQGLANIEAGDNPTNNDWRVCSDAVNLMETFIREMRLCEDTSGLLLDAITALAYAGKRKLEGKPLRLDGPGIFAVRAVLEDYASLLDQLPHRTVVRCHRLTEKRISDIHRGI